MLLKQRIAILSETVAIYKQAQVKIMAYISEKVKNTMTEFDSLTLKCEEGTEHFESRVYEIINELQATKNLLKGANSEKDKLKQEDGLSDELPFDL